MIGRRGFFGGIVAGCVGLLGIKIGQTSPVAIEPNSQEQVLRDIDRAEAAGREWFIEQDEDLHTVRPPALRGQAWRVGKPSVPDSVLDEYNEAVLLAEDEAVATDIRMAADAYRHRLLWEHAAALAKSYGKPLKPKRTKIL